MELNAIQRWSSISADLWKANQVKKQRAAGKLKPGERIDIESPHTGYKTRHNDLDSSNNDLTQLQSDNDSDDNPDNNTICDKKNTVTHTDTGSDNDSDNDVDTDIDNNTSKLSLPHSTVRRTRFKLSEQIDALKLPTGQDSNSSRIAEVIYRMIRRFIKVCRICLVIVTI